MTPQHDRGHSLRWVWYGLAAMFVLIGLGVFISALSGRSTSVGGPFDFGWVGGLFGLFIFLCFFGWIFSWGGPWRRRYYWGRGWYRDEASEVLRARYAKGEITKEQFEQMMRDLEQHS